MGSHDEHFYSDNAGGLGVPVTQHAFAVIHVERYGQVSDHLVFFKFVLKVGDNVFRIMWSSHDDENMTGKVNSQILIFYSNFYSHLCFVFLCYNFHTHMSTLIAGTC